MKLDILQNKAKIVGNLMGKKVRVSAWGRKYRVDLDDNGTDQSVFTVAYLPAQDLWNRLDFAQTALEAVGRKHHVE